MNNINNRKISFILAVLIIISSIISLGNISKVFAMESKENDLLKYAEFELEDKGDGTGFLIFNFKKEDGGINPGDTIEFQIINENISSYKMAREHQFINAKSEQQEIVANFSLGDDGVGKIKFNENIKKMLDVEMGFELNLRDITLKDPNKEGKLDLKFNDEIKGTIEIIASPQDNNNIDNDTMLRKTGDTITDNFKNVRWGIVLNEAMKTYNPIHAGMEIKISDKIEDSMNLNKGELSITVHNGKESFLVPLEEAKNKGIDIDIKDNNIDIVIKPYYNHDHNVHDIILNGRVVSISFEAEIKNEILMDYNISHVNNKLEVYSEMDDFKNIPEVNKNASVEIFRDKFWASAIKPGNIKIYKHAKGDEKNPISNVTFELSDLRGDIKGSVKTDDNGYAEFENLSPGEYLIKEIWAPNTIKKESYISKEITIEKDKGLYLKLENEIIEPEDTTDDNYSLLIKKVIKGTEKPIADVVFRLEKDGITIQEGRTDSIGTLEFNNLKKGHYMLTEISAPNNIKFDSKKPFSQEIEIIEGQSSEIKIWVENELKETPKEPDSKEPNNPDSKEPNNPDSKEPNNPDSKEPNNPDSKEPNNPDPYEPEDRPYERPGNPTNPKEETRPKEPNKNEPIKPEEPKEVDVEEIEEVEESKENNIDSNKVESNKKEKEEEEEIKIVAEKTKENINVFDKNKAPQTGDEFSLVLNILVLMASILGLYTVSKKRK